MRVLITREIPRAGIDILRKRPQLELDIRKGSPLSDKDLKKSIVGVDAIVPVIPDKITKEVLEAAGPQLKLVAAYSVGYDHIDVSAATSMGIYVSNTPGDLTQAVAEHSFALLMAVARKVVAADRFVADGKYKYWDPMIFLGPTLQGNTIGIVGMGRIGQRMAKIAKSGFDMKVLYHDVTRNDKVEMESGALYVSLDDLLERSDFVSLYVPLMPATHHLIGRNELKKMRPAAILVNTSRGPVIDEDALAVALKENWIEGAGIDVFENEPNIYKLLKQVPNAVLTPHIGSATREARIEMARMVAEDVIEVLLNKKPPINLVNKDLKTPRL